jgi:Uma2 family endonuclease
MEGKAKERRERGKGEGERAMAIMVLDSDMEAQILAERVGSDGDRYDEVWEGVYIVTPLPNNDHQVLVGELSYVLGETVGRTGLGQVFPGANLSDRAEGWKTNYREPDVAVFLRGGRAIDRGTHWQGAADFLVEIISPGERTREKIPFYSGIGVVELLVIDREPWTLELYRHENGQLTKVGQSTLAAPDVIEAKTVVLTFELLPGEPRPQIRATHSASGRQWVF